MATRKTTGKSAAAADATHGNGEEEATEAAKREEEAQGDTSGGLPPVGEGDEFAEAPDESTKEGRLEADGYEPIADGAKYVIVSERTDGLNTRTLEVKAVNEESQSSRMLETGDVLEVVDYDSGLV